MITDILKKLHFTDKEIQVYLAVLEHGRLTPAQVSKYTHINRTTVYSTAKELVKKGLLTEDIAGTTRTLVALPPTSLERLHEHEKKILDKKKLLTMQAVRELDAFTRETKYSVPKIVFVEEDGVEAHLYRQTPVWNASILERNSEWLGFQDASFVKQYEPWIDWYWEQDSSERIHLKLLSNEKAEEIKKKKFSRRQIRFWNKTENFTATTWVLGDYVTMIISGQRPRSLVEIHDPVLAHNMREVFKGLWKEVFN